MKIEAGIENLEKILANRQHFYQIPDYQRPYSWDKDQVSDLIDDLLTAFINNRKEKYFCGSLVLVHNEKDNRLDVIDGQQRITTFTILACVFRELFQNELLDQANDFINDSIRDKYENTKRKLKFLTNDVKQNEFEETILKGIVFEDIKPTHKKLSKNKYLQNAYYIKEALVEKINDNDISANDFIIWFYENVVLTFIICPSQDSAIQIFNVLNDRGMPLSSVDILKSTLMQMIQDSQEDRRIFKATWEQINSHLEFVDSDFETMLMIYLYYKKPSNPEQKLHNELKIIFEKEKTSALEIIYEIKRFTNAYVELLSLKDKYIYCLKYLSHRVYWNSILTTAMFNDYTDLEELKKLLVAYYYQNWIAGATVARIKQTSFNVLKLVKDKKPISSIKEEMKTNLDKYRTADDYKNELKSSEVSDRKWAKPLLILLEYFSQEEDNMKFIALNKKLHLEHILPQEPEKHGWDKIFTVEEIDEWTNALANLTLLSMRKNSQASNYDFKMKRKIYEKEDSVTTPYIITRNIFECHQWTVDELKERRKELIDKTSKILDLF